MIFIPQFCGPIFTLFFEIAVILCWGYLCRRILLIPIDLILGKTSQIVYFSSQCYVEDLEFFKNTHYYVWRFCLKNNQSLTLLVPIGFKKEETTTIAPPAKNARLQITYFRFSKILLEWHLN